ncbi:hypothetical protein J6590_031938 [Homalodisca vitripennis]|nr:hypothetical protein J6590_031938 [Homalodisca vitripennis]
MWRLGTPPHLKLQAILTGRYIKSSLLEYLFFLAKQSNLGCTGTVIELISVMLLMANDPVYSSVAKSKQESLTQTYYVVRITPDNLMEFEL